MLDYQQYPPIKYFTRVLKNCPRSAFLYTQIWSKRNKHGALVTEKNHVRKDYLISPTIFRNLLAPLMAMNLIYFVESDDKFEIAMLGPHVHD